MQEQSIQALRDLFGSDLTIHTNEETGERFVWGHELGDAIKRRYPQNLLGMAAKVLRLPGGPHWVCFREEDRPMLDQAIREARQSRN